MQLTIREIYIEQRDDKWTIVLFLSFRSIAVIFPFDKGRQWVSNSTLSAQFGKYDSDNAHRVVLNQQDLRIINNKNIQDRDLISEMRSSNYIVNKNCPEHYIWIKHQKQSKKTKLPFIHKHPNDKHYK